MQRHQSLTRAILIALSFLIGDISEAHIDKNKQTKLDKEIVCLAKNIYFEAKHEPYKGKLAVGFVTINRLELDRFPDSICGVVQQSRYWRGNPVRSKCQFSWFCDGKSDKPKQDEEWQSSVAVAKTLLVAPSKDITNGATHFHATYVNPGWSRKMTLVATIGKHKFYRYKNSQITS